LTGEREVLDEQIAYYRARAPEYDEWFLRQGLCDLGPEWNERWHDEVESVAAKLVDFAPSGRVLELACGTGWWTQRLAAHAGDLTCVDASPEAIGIASERVPSARYVVADLFEWEPDRTYDVVFFSFWLSHVPAPRFEAFWGLVDSALAPGGRVFFIDNLVKKLPELDEATRVRKASMQYAGARDGEVIRRLNDGREFRAVKIYYQPDHLMRRLAALGWKVEIESTDWFLYYGRGSRG
jgi:demethylmenaquinone methyltransferase/2-methoxy-6-polyprenyl-1,4-benzoquinol methylase